MWVGFGFAEDVEEEGWGEFGGGEVEGAEEWGPVVPLQENGGDLGDKLVLFELRSPVERRRFRCWC